ncbi:MAG TPA: cohesin domain-containing protein, partial [Thermoanaerobaculia bacterium]|nr:cohesin domain-containing protein [Thermoanaerobaculia bacterium]
GITFTAESGGGSNSISLASGSGTDLNNLVLEVRANSVQDLYGVAFDLQYPTTVLRYDSATAGFLNEGAAQTSLNLVEASPGTLVVGYTRLGPVGGATGSGVLLTLRFSAVAAGSGNFAFAQSSAFNPRGDSSAVTWSAGSVQVVR